MWSENLIAAALADHFERKFLVMVPKCGWTGHECDILAVTQNLRVIDIEVKISRADLKADADKAKWFHRWNYRIDGPQHEDAKLRKRLWPKKVWKHYYCLPAAIWKDDLLASLPSPHSGVLLINETGGHRNSFSLYAKRAARSCRDAEPISPEDAVDIARLASLRMWNTYRAMERMKDDHARQRKMWSKD